MMQESISRSKSYYSSLHSKLQLAEPDCNPEMMQVQTREMERQGKQPHPKRGQKSQLIHQSADLPGHMSLVGGAAVGDHNMGSWAGGLGANAGKGSGQVLWGKAREGTPSKQGVAGQMMNMATGMHQQKAGAKETLDELEEALKTELYLADCPAAGPSERRVLVHANVWEKFMDRFKAYRPLLTKIKQEYDMVLHKYSNQLHVLNATQFKMASENLSKSEEFLEMKNKANDEITMLRAKLDGLTKDKETEGKSMAAITKMVEHWKVQASTRVPMVKLQMAETECEETKQDLNKERELHDDTRKIVESLQDEIARLKGEITKQKKVMGDMTPRPEWDELAANVPELADAFNKSTASCDRFDEVSSMLKKATAAVNKMSKKKGAGKSGKAKDKDAFDYFTGMGTAKDVPKYLQTNGRVKNNHLPKGQCEDLVKDCWEAKNEYDEAENKKTKLGEYFPVFLENKFGKEKIIEAAYNMWFALKDYSYDSDCDLFLRILQGKMDEEVYVDQMQMLDNLQNSFVKADQDINAGKTTNFLQKETLKTVFIEFFPVKSDKELKECFKALEKEYPTDQVEYPLIFAEDEEGNQGDFIEGVRDQHLTDREDYIDSLEEALWDQDEEDCGEITVQHVTQAFETFDRDKPWEEIGELLSRTLGMPTAKIKPNKVVAIPAILQTIKGMSTHRRTKKDG